MTTSNLIELPTQLILVDTPLLPDSTNEVLTYAKDLGKPTSRVYISHGHPDHFAGAGLVGAPLYALPSVAAAINNGGGAIIRGALALTGHGRIEPGGLRALVAAIPPGHRAGVMSAFYIAAYASLSVPAVLAGLVFTHIALSSTFEVFGSVVAGIALIVAFETWRTRPARMRAPTDRDAVTTANDIHPVTITDRHPDHRGAPR